MTYSLVTLAVLVPEAEAAVGQTAVEEIQMDQTVLVVVEEDLVAQEEVEALVAQEEVEALVAQEEVEALVAQEEVEEAVSI
jgi:hypothetical protein